MQKRLYIAELKLWSVLTAINDSGVFKNVCSQIGSFVSLSVKQTVKKHLCFHRTVFKVDT